uniref:Uncharacterized protein n=1 Tax=Macaca fascicularis TaxID=9541 RepID=A0A7N9IES0_MACFA
VCPNLEFVSLSNKKLKKAVFEIGSKCPSSSDRVSLRHPGWSAVWHRLGSLQSPPP